MCQGTAGAVSAKGRGRAELEGFNAGVVSLVSFSRVLKVLTLPPYILPAKLTCAGRSVFPSSG